MVCFFKENRANYLRLDGKTAVITGCNTGIGKATAHELCKRGARVIMACRNLEKAQTTAEYFKQNVAQTKNAGEVVVKELDLASFKSVRRCVEEILATEEQIHILVNNAGTIMCARELTEDGHEMHFGVNHLGHFLFTLLLLPRIIKSAPARIVTVSSMIYAWDDGDMHYNDITLRNSYSPFRAYRRSKLANVLFTTELAKRLRESGVTSYCVHPGFVVTDSHRNMDRGSFLTTIIEWMYPWRNLIAIFIKNEIKGAQTTLHCCLDEEAGRENGLYYSDCKPRRLAAVAQNPEGAKQLWDYSWNAVGFAKDYDPFVKR